MSLINERHSKMLQNNLFNMLKAYLNFYAEEILIGVNSTAIEIKKPH